MSTSLKKQAFVGVGWNAIGRFSSQGVSFILQIFLARLLSPSDYGIIAMIAIFLQVSAVFVDSGFGKFLIQRQSCSQSDYSTVFYYNLGVAFILYILLYAIAPLVAGFYKIELLKHIMRVISIVIIINALTIVPRAKLEKSIDFKSISIITFSSSLLSGLLGIFMAYSGFGVWSLCYQTLSNSILQCFLFSYFVRWRPSLLFCKEAFYEMFTFGSKIIGASLISVIYSNLYTIIIGKKFNARDLGYYSRADQFATFPSANIGQIISSVAFPLLSKIQDDNVRLEIAYRSIIRYSSYIIFPLMIGMASVAGPFINVVLGENWLDTIPYLQVLCMALLWDHLSSLNLNLLYVKGKSDLVLKLEIIKKTIAVIILFSSIPFGIITMCLGRVAYGIIAFIINTYYTKQLIGLSCIQQILDVFPYLLLSLIVGAIMFFISMMVTGPSILILTVCIVIGIILYLTISFVCFSDIRRYTLAFLSNKNSNI